MSYFRKHKYIKIHNFITTMSYFRKYKYLKVHILNSNILSLSLWPLGTKQKVFQESVALDFVTVILHYIRGDLIQTLAL